MYVNTVTEFCQLCYLNPKNDMQTAGRIAHNILLYQTPLQTIGIKLLMLIFERNNNICSMHIFPYFLVNTVTIVSTLLLQKRITAFEYHKSVFCCLSWKITRSQICQQDRINLIDTTVPITTGYNVHSSTLLPFSQLCYPRWWTMSTLLPSCNWLFKHGN